MLKSRYGVIALSLLFAFSLTSGITLTPITIYNLDTISNSMSISDSTPLLTWTSNTQSELNPVTNNSKIVGDHIILNATFPESMNVIYCELRIWNVSANINITVSSSSSNVTIDTYYMHHQNLTYNIQVIGNSSDDGTWTNLWQEIEICNFFKPLVTVPYPETLLIDSRTYNISWSSIDKNADEVNYFSVWISNNDGATFMLIAPNVTRTWLIWNSTGWLEGSYIFRVRAFSVDLAYPGLDVSNPPSGYLPGDYSDGFSPSFEPTPPPPPITTTEGTTSTTGETTTTTNSNTNGFIPESTLIFFIDGFAIAVIVIVIVLILKNKR